MATPALRKQPGIARRLSGSAVSQPNKHQAKTAETRSKLLRSARKIFAKDGFEAARLEDIAHDAGHTRGAFYAHFASKEDLFFALLEQQILHYLQSIESALEGESATAKKLYLLREYYVSRMNDPNWSILMIEFKLFAARHPKIRARLASEHRAMRKSFGLGGLAQIFHEPVTHSGLPKETVRVVLESLFHSLVLQRTYDPLSLSKEDAAEVLRRVFDLLVR